MTIIVSSTDGYKDLWPNFFKCKAKYWQNCQYPTFLVNNIERPNITDVNVINCGVDASWSERMRKALNQIDTEYVCFLLEDFFITNHVDNKNIQEALQYMQSNNIKYYKLLTINPIETPFFKDSKFLKILPANYPYGISLMAAIWDRKFFLEKIGNQNYNPWKFETDRLKEENNSGSEIVGIYDNRNILNITHMVVQGQYLLPSLKKAYDLGLKMSLADRPAMSLKSYIFYKVKGYIGIKMRKYPLIAFLLKPIVKKHSVAYKYR